VLVDLEHALDAFCGRRENGEVCEADFAKRSLEYFHQMVAQCVEQKVSRIIACDTTGGANPEEVTQLFAGLTHAHPEARYGFHGHTDRGLGIANTRAAIQAGAVQVQGTILGTGERCGNVNLTTVIGSMQLRGEAEFVPPEALAGLTGLAQAAYAAFSLEAPHGVPIVGRGGLRDMGRNAWKQRGQRPRGVPVVRSSEGRRKPADWGQRAVWTGQYYSAVEVAGCSSECGASADAAGQQPGND
jgi:2-isopropylmalate synthase